MKWGSIWSSIFDFHSVDLDDLDEFELDVDLELDFIGFFTIKSSSKSSPNRVAHELLCLSSIFYIRNQV